METTVIGTIISFLTSEEGLNLLAWLLGIIFSALFSSDKIKQWIKDAKIAKLKDAAKYLEAAVLQNRELVEKMKSENGGKLTEEQKVELEEKVVENLKQSAKLTGIDVIRIIGPDLIRPAITYAVKKLKSKVSKVEVPEDVVKLFEDK